MFSCYPGSLGWGQSEGFPRTRYFIPQCVGLVVDSSKRVVPRAPFGQFDDFSGLGLGSMLLRFRCHVLLQNLALVLFSCPGAWRGSMDIVLANIINLVPPAWMHANETLFPKNTSLRPQRKSSGCQETNITSIATQWSK